MSSIEKAVNSLDNRFDRPNAELSSLPAPRLVSTDPVVAEPARGELAAAPLAEVNAVGEDDSAHSESAPERPAPLILPVEAFRKAGIICPDEPKSLIAEEYRSVKRPMLNYIGRQESDEERSANVIMVSSCISGEGKTFSAINLALSMAMERSQQVLLVDGDIAKASAGETFGLTHDTRGLLDLLQETSPDIESALIQTDLPNLCLLPAGQPSDHGAELLASEAMATLVQHLSERHADQVVIIDSPPLLMTNEANVIAELVGQVLFVVAAESTSHDMVKDALARLTGSPNVGLVLNKVRKNAGRGNGYGYGYGYQNDKRRPASRSRS